jgi:hypothetical protein
VTGGQVGAAWKDAGEAGERCLKADVTRDDEYQGHSEISTITATTAASPRMVYATGLFFPDTHIACHVASDRQFASLPAGY